MNTKSILFIVILLFAAINIHAQTVLEGSFDSLQKVTRVDFEFDYSECSFTGMTLEEFCDYEQDWEIDQPGIQGKFYDKFHDVQSEIIFGRFHQSQVKGVMKIFYVMRDGDMQAELRLVDSVSGELLLHVGNIRVKGGKIGTRLNLMGDGMANLGKKLGRYMAKNIKKVRK